MVAFVLTNNWLSTVSATLIAGYSLVMPSLSFAAEELPAIGVSNPFDTIEKRMALVAAVDGLPQSFLDNAANVAYYGYEVEQMTSCPHVAVCAGQPPTFWKVFRRTIKIRLTTVEAGIAAALAKAEEHACSYSRVRSFRYGYNTEAYVRYFANIYYTKRTCDNILGKHDLAHASGRIITTLSLKKTAPNYQTAQRGAVTLDPDVDVDQIKGDLLGFISVGDIGDTVKNAILGGLLTALISEAARDDLVHNVKKAVDQVDLAAAAAKIAAGIQSYSEFMQILKDLIGEHPRYPDYLDLPNTNLECDGSGCNLKISDVRFVPAKFAKFVYAFRQCEIKVLASLDQSQSRAYVVQRGESLWSIAARDYCSGEMYLYIGSQNQSLLPNGRLHAGQVITLDPIHKFIGLRKNIVQRGDSLWKRWASSSRKKTWREFRNSRPAFSRRSHRIFSLQVNTLD